MADTPAVKDDISIVIAGAAGQGVQTVELLLTRMLKLCGYHFFATKEYMSRVRGGSNSTEIRVASRRVSAYSERIDFLFPLSAESLKHVSGRIDPGTLIIGECEKLAGATAEDCPALDIPFTKLAVEIGSPLFSNIIAVGVISGFFALDQTVIEAYLSDYFARKGEDIVSKNLVALKKGYGIGKGLVEDGTVAVGVEPDSSVKDDIVLNGAEAVGLGAIAGGCNFISTYPMSPSTAVLVFLAQQSKQFDIIAEQAEDEIAGINMAIGAWYAGARALTSTSGGGFALMAEGTSLAGMFESPIVIHVAQRPGPATGLPTRTEQGDLELVLYAGHGEFPRIILAPGSIEDAFELSRKAFDLADKFQVPVFVLTDQYLIDSYYNLGYIDVAALKSEHHVVRTGSDYKRYELTETGISPRGIPGYGDGLVVIDSDEHDEAGHITEDLDIRVAMQDKRLGKLKHMIGEAIPPVLIGKEDSPNIVVCWGSTYLIVREAIERTGRDDIALLYFRQVYPLHPDTASFFEKASRTAVVENNATSQFGKVLKLHADVDIQEKILKYNGMPFSVEELTTILEATF